jgi:hypothetical protein
MTETESINIEGLIDVMDERYRIGNKLFGILLNKSQKPLSSSDPGGPAPSAFRGGP